MFKPKLKGFTLLEILLVVGIIAILAGIVIVAINPSKQLAATRNSERKSDLKQLNNALQQYYIDNGTYPADVESATSWTEICDTGDQEGSGGAVECTGFADLADLVPAYLVAIPVDPLGPVVAFFDQLITKVYAALGGTGYYVIKPSTKIALNTEQAELDVVIAIGTTTAMTATSTPGGELASGLIGYWPFNGNANDSYGTNDGSEQGGVSYTAEGLISQAASFDGSDDYISFSGGSPANDSTASVWIYPTYEEANVDCAHSTPYFGISYAQLSLNDSELCWYSELFGGGWSTVAGTNVPLNTWSHIVATVDSTNGTFNLYLNGDLVHEQLGGGTGPYSSDLPERGIGGWPDMGGSGQFTGYIDEAAVWDRILSGSEISQLYNSGSGVSLVE